MEGEIEIIETRRREERERECREEVSASAMVPDCPVSRKGTSNTRKAIDTGQSDVRTLWT